MLKFRRPPAGPTPAVAPWRRLPGKARQHREGRIGGGLEAPAAAPPGGPAGRVQALLPLEAVGQDVRLPHYRGSPLACQAWCCPANRSGIGRAFWSRRSKRRLHRALCERCRVIGCLVLWGESGGRTRGRRERGPGGSCWRREDRMLVRAAPSAPSAGPVGGKELPMHADALRFRGRRMPWTPLLLAALGGLLPGRLAAGTTPTPAARRAALIRAPRGPAAVRAWPPPQRREPVVRHRREPAGALASPRLLRRCPQPDLVGAPHRPVHCKPLTAASLPTLRRRSPIRTGAAPQRSRLLVARKPRRGGAPGAAAPGDRDRLRAMSPQARCGPYGTWSPPQPQRLGSRR